RGERVTEQEALRVVASERPQRLELGRRLESLGDRRQLERVCEPDDRLDDAGVLRLAAEPADERAVDLQRLDREALEVRQRRVSGPEVVDAQTHALAAQRLQRVDRRR